MLCVIGDRRLHGSGIRSLLNVRASDIANSWRTTGDIGDLFTGWSNNCPCMLILWLNNRYG